MYLSTYSGIYMINTLKGSQTIKWCWVPYGRLLSEIFHQGGILDAIRKANVSYDKQLAQLLARWSMVALSGIWSSWRKKTTKSWLQIWRSLKLYPIRWKSFPSICMQDPLDLRVSYIMKQFGRTLEWKMFLKQCMVVLFQLLLRRESWPRKNICQKPLKKLLNPKEGVKESQSCYSSRSN